MDLFEPRHRQAVKQWRVRGHGVGRQGGEAKTSCTSDRHGDVLWGTCKALSHPCPLRHMCQAPKWAHYQFMKDKNISWHNSSQTGQTRGVLSEIKHGCVLNTAFQTRDTPPITGKKKWYFGMLPKRDSKRLRLAEAHKNTFTLWMNSIELNLCHAHHGDQMVCLTQAYWFCVHFEFISTLVNTRSTFCKTHTTQLFHILGGKRYKKVQESSIDTEYHPYTVYYIISHADTVTLKSSKATDLLGWTEICPFLHHSSIERLIKPNRFMFLYLLFYFWVVYNAQVWAASVKTGLMNLTV